MSNILKGLTTVALMVVLTACSEPDNSRVVYVQEYQEDQEYDYIETEDCDAEDFYHRETDCGFTKKQHKNRLAYLERKKAIKAEEARQKALKKQYDKSGNKLSQKEIHRRAEQSRRDKLKNEQTKKDKAKAARKAEKERKKAAKKAYKSSSSSKSTSSSKSSSSSRRR